MLTRRSLLQGIGWLAAVPAAVIGSLRGAPRDVLGRFIVRVPNRDILRIHVSAKQFVENDWTALTLIAWEKGWQPRVVDHVGMTVIEYVHGQRQPREITHPGRHCGQSLRLRVMEQLRKER